MCFEVTLQGQEIETTVPVVAVEPTKKLVYPLYNMFLNTKRCCMTKKKWIIHG